MSAHPHTPCHSRQLCHLIRLTGCPTVLPCRLLPRLLVHLSRRPTCPGTASINHRQHPNRSRIRCSCRRPVRSRRQRTLRPSPGTSLAFHRQQQRPTFPGPPSSNHLLYLNRHLNPCSCRRRARRRTRRRTRCPPPCQTSAFRFPWTCSVRRTSWSCSSTGRPALVHPWFRGSTRSIPSSAGSRSRPRRDGRAAIEGTAAGRP